VSEQRASPKLLAPLALLLAWVAFFPGQLFGDVVPFLRDDVLTYLPLRQYIHQRLAQGEFPAWYPYEALGVPLPGQLAVGLFHPATYLLCFMDYARAVKWNLLLALLLALVGAYRWARALFASRPAAVTAAFSFGFGGYALGTSSTLPYTMSFATLPWIGWALDGLVRRRRADYAGALALLLALVLLAGDPQSLLLSSLLLPCALLGAKGSPRRPLVLATLAAAAGALCCAIDVLPGRVLFAGSVRVQGHATADLARFWALPPGRLLELVTPGFLPDALLESTLEQVLHAGPGVFCTTVFAGAVTLVLAVLGVRGRRHVAYAALAVLALWLALGDAGGLLPLVQKLLPPLGRMRYPEKYLSFFWLALVPLVAAGADRLLRDGSTLRFKLVGVAAAVGVLAFVAPSFVSAPELAGLGGAWRFGLLVSAVFAAALAVVPALPPRAAALVLPALMFAELLHGNGDHLPMVPRALLDAPPPVVAQLKAGALPNGPPPRVFSRFPYPRDTATNPAATQTAKQMLAALYPDTSGLYGIASVGPRNGGFSLRYASLLGAGNERVARFGAWAGVCATVRGDATQTSAADAASCLGPAYVAGAVNAADASGALEWMRRQPPTGADTIVWENGPELAPPRAATVRWVSWAPEKIELSVETSDRAALVLADELTPGWSAAVDGVETPLRFSLIALRGLEVPAGTHAVTFEYRTPMLRAGAALSAIGVLLSLLAIVLGRRARSVERLAVVPGGAAGG